MYTLCGFLGSAEKNFAHEKKIKLRSAARVLGLRKLVGTVQRLFQHIHLLLQGPNLRAQFLDRRDAVRKHGAVVDAERLLHAILLATTRHNKAELLC